MSQPRRHDDALLELTWLACHGTASDEQIAELSDWLQADPEAMQSYVQFMAMHADLQWDYVDKVVLPTDVPLMEDAVAAPIVTTDSAGSPKVPAATALLSVVDEDVSLPVGSAEFRGMLNGLQQWPTTSWSSLVLLALFVAVMGAIGAETWLSLRRPDQVERVAQDKFPVVTPVAYLTSANGCAWGSGATEIGKVGSGVQLGDEVTLYEGIAEFRLSSGVSLSVEGPASLVMATPSSLVLQEGKLTAIVPWKAADFQILTGTNRLTAVEAEFGVQAKGNNINIHVFSGEVAAELSPYSVGEQASVFDNGFAGDEDFRPSPIVIEQSEAVELTSTSDGSTSIRRFAADQGQFASRNTMSRQLPITPRYVGAVKQSNPIAYWRFESVENHEIRNEIPTGCPLNVTTEVYLRGDETNRVLESGYAFDKGNLMSAEPMDRFFNGDFSVELWIKPSHFHRGTFVSLMEKSYPQENLTREEFERQNARFGYGFGFGTSPDFGISPGTVRGSVRDPSKNLTADNCASENNLYKLRHWQHIVIVRGRWGMRLYFDGQQVAAVPSKRKVALAEGQHLTVGRLLPSWDGHAFVGQLDELSIYDHALSPEEIKEHYDAVNVEAVERKRQSESRKGKAVRVTERVVNS